MQKIIFVSLIAIMSLTLSLSPALTPGRGRPVFAQDADVEVETISTDEATPTLFSDNIDTVEELPDPEEVTAEELEISEPGMFSWFGNIVRNVRIAITRDPIKKSELELKKASEQLLRVRKIVHETPDDPRLQERLEEMDGKYETLIGKINTRIENYKDENPEEPKLKDFLDKYTSQQLKHQEILKRVELNVPEQIMEKIQTNRIIHLEKFGEVMQKLQTKEELKVRLENAVKNVGLETSALKAGVENLIERRANRAGILEELEEKVPAIKAQIREIKDDSVQLFQELKVKREEIQQNREELKQETREEAQNMMQENQEIRQEVREQTQENNPGVGERIMNVFRNKDELNATSDEGQSETSPTNARTNMNR